MKKIAFVVLSVLFVAAYATAQTPPIGTGATATDVIKASNEKIPLPEDIKIVPPASDAPEEIKMLMGKWKTEGWFTERGFVSAENMLIVEKIDMEKKEVYGIFAWGNNPGTEKGYLRFVGELRPEENIMIVFKNKENGAMYKFILNPEKNP